MKLTIAARSADKKSDAKALRRNGKIPTVIYHRSKEAEAVAVDAVEFQAALRQIPKGRLSTTQFELIDGKNSRRAIVKDIQYHPTSYEVIHLDFEELLPDVAVQVRVPVECVGLADCAGIKLGGQLRMVIRKVRISCLPKDIPSCFELNVQHLELRQSKRVKDLVIPQTVRLLGNPEEVVVVIAKR